MSDGSAVERKASEQRRTAPQWSGRRPNSVGRLRSGAEGVRTASDGSAVERKAVLKYPDTCSITTRHGIARVYNYSSAAYSHAHASMAAHNKQALLKLSHSLREQADDLLRLAEEAPSPHQSCRPSRNIAGRDHSPPSSDSHGLPGEFYRSFSYNCGYQLQLFISTIIIL